MTDVLKIPEGDSMNLEELKRLYAPTIIPDENQRMARATFEEYMHDAWPHILAKLEAAQRLRDAAMDYSIATTDGYKMKMLEALAAFDKEQQ